MWPFPSKWNDNPACVPDTVAINRWPFRIRPKGERYRIIEYPLKPVHRYGLQSYYHGQWVDMQTYDDGCDDYGKIKDAKWVELRTQCSWTVDGLKSLIHELKGEPEPFRVVEEG